jgi:tetratricopeptide (TPR) repeat protein
VPTAGPAPSRARVSDAAVQPVDIVPSVLDALGVPVPGGLPGRTFVSQNRTASALRASYFEALSASLNRGWAPLRGVLVDREKYIELPLPELYDLGRDPREGTNRADAGGTRRAVLEARLKEFGDTGAAGRVAENAQTAARLQALGYTSGSAAPRKAYTVDDDPKRLIGLDQDMHRAVVLFNDGRLREAADIYRTVVSKRPDMGLAYLHLAFLEWELGETGRAIATLRTARERVGADTEVDSRLGMYLAETGALAEAVPLLEATARRPDAGVDALNALGIAYARTGDRRKALATFTAILAIDPRNAMTLQNMGSVHLEEGNLAAANDAFTRALDVNPEWAAAYTGLGVVRLRLKDRPGAIAAWAKAVELNPTDFDALFNLATELVNDRQFQRARPYLERFVREAPPAFYGPDIARLLSLLAQLPR